MQIVIIMRSKKMRERYFHAFVFFLLSLFVIPCIAEERDTANEDNSSDSTCIEYDMPDGSHWRQYEIHDPTHGPGTAYERMNLNDFNPIYSYFFDRLSVVWFGDKERENEAMSSIKAVLNRKIPSRKKSEIMLKIRKNL